MSFLQLEVLRECAEQQTDAAQICFQLCRYHYTDGQHEGYRFVWKIGDVTISTDELGMPSIGVILKLTAQALEEGWGQLASEQAEPKSNGQEESEAEPSQLCFPVGSFLQRGGVFYQVLSNEDDFVGRCLDMTGEPHDPFYFQYGEERSELVTDPDLLERLQEAGQLLQQHLLPTEDFMLDVGFTRNVYDGVGYYEMNITDFDRATEVAELAGMKFDKHSGVHHVILQCRENFENCIFFCDNDYWEVHTDVFIELIHKLSY